MRTLIQANIIEGFPALTHATGPIELVGETGPEVRAHEVKISDPVHEPFAPG